MLRESSQTHEQSINLNAIMQGGDAGGIEHATTLTAFAEAIVQRQPGVIEKARNDLIRVAGDEVMIDTAGVASNFERMVRIADSTGIIVGPLDAATEALQQTLGIDQFDY